MLIHVFADVGPERPAIMYLIAQRVPRDFDVAPHGEGSEEEEIIHNLEGLTSRIPDYARFDDVPCAYKRHTAGVSNCVHHLFRRLVHAVAYDHEHHVN